MSHKMSSAYFNLGLSNEGYAALVSPCPGRHRILHNLASQVAQTRGPRNPICLVGVPAVGKIKNHCLAEKLHPLS